MDSLGAHKALNSFYLVNLTNTDPQEVLNHLKGYVDSDDRLMVVRFTGKPAFTKAHAGTNNWIKDNT